MKVLALKELREVLGIAVVALGFYLALVLNLMGTKIFAWLPFLPDSAPEVPFHGDGFAEAFTWMSAALALALGFRQSAWEASKGTYLFLLHRPIRRNAIFLTKLAVGLGVYLACASAPILMYGWWASVPGAHAGPFEWSMTGTGWGMLLLVLPFYLSAFLSGLRPARWFGTRLLPLLSPLAFLTVMSQLSFLPGAVALLLEVLMFAALTVSICYVARVRDYA